MKKSSYRVWLYSWILVIAGLSIISAFSERTAFDILRSLGNAEASVGFWMKHGTSLFWAVIIGVACSTYDIVNWFLLFHWLKEVYPKSIKPVYQRIYGEEAVTTNAETPWLAKAHRIGEWVYRSCVPQPDRVPNSATITLRHYCPLLFYGACPGSIWTGVGYVFSFKLNVFGAFFTLGAANAVKIAAFGYLALVTNVWVVFVIVFATPLVRKRIETALKTSDAEAEASPASMPPV